MYMYKQTQNNKNGEVLSYIASSVHIQFTLQLVYTGEIPTAHEFYIFCSVRKIRLINQVLCTIPHKKKPFHYAWHPYLCKNVDSCKKRVNPNRRFYISSYSTKTDVVYIQYSSNRCVGSQKFLHGTIYICAAPSQLHAS